ncbi:MAG: adenylate/guanylate cyclase domain-containing protein, partial [bacterium]
TLDRELPSGTVTFLFTDIEGSTQLLQQLGPSYNNLLEEHRRLLRAAIEAEGGHEVNTEGDSFFVAFSSAARASAAAATAQRALAGHPWPDGAALRVRMGLHTGEATPVGRDYVGLDVHRAARINAAGWGGQILVSQATKTLIEHALPSGVSLRDLGEHRLKDLQRPERLFQIVLSGLQTDFPPPRTLDATPNNLPTQLTSFIGREREVAAARRLLDTTRLLTLTGPGGTGKTRLSLQLAAEVADEFPHGVYFVPLAPITDHTLVAPTVAQSLGVQDTRGRLPLERLQEYLRDKRMLLVLDNFEQVVAAAPFVAELLKAGPDVKAVVTSRAALRLYGEQEFPVPPLQLPDPKHLPGPESLSQYEAVALFIQRAVAVKPDFTVTNENAPAVAEITSRLDGLPLAIELAAARIKILPPQAMLTRLGHRLSLLCGGARDLPARQQTLRGAIAWSHDLLTSSSQRLMARLSVFVGPFTLEETDAVCGPAEELGIDVLEGLAGLVDQSLLRQNEERGEARFTILETIREFAAERLEAGEEAGEIRRRHAMTYLALAEQAAGHIPGPEQPVWLDRLEDAHDNLRAALDWAMKGVHTEIALRMGAALWRYWQMRGHLHEGRALMTKIMALPDVITHAKAWSKALEAAGGIAYWQGDMAAAEAFYEKNLSLQRELKDKAGIANALYNLAFAYGAALTDLEKARSLYLESLPLYEELGDQAGIARVHWGLAYFEYSVANYSGAREHYAVSLPILRSLGDKFSLAWALHLLGLIGAKTGERDAAYRSFVEALTLFAEGRDISGIVMAVDDLSTLAADEGDLERAARLAGGATALQKSSGADLASVASIAEARPRLSEKDLGQERLIAAWREGHVMSVDELVAYALRRDN